ncbi:MAG: alpha-rhamnosidase, partial [Tannerella sp.]|nr:alpha-rhamnosidase [Tannerella sp.]
ELKARLETDDNELKKIFETGWRTARLCAVETYMDCPYYEQLQYLGDARIQALVSLYNSGDDRLVKNFLNLTDWSRQPEGITMSRYPTTEAQFITPFALWHIGALHDYLMYGSDVDFVRRKLPGVRMILDYFARFQQEDGSLRNLPWWNFTDWVYTGGWDFGVALQGKDGSSALMDLQLLWAYQVAADLEKKSGISCFAEIYDLAARKLEKAVQQKYWDETRGLYANNSDKVFFSQHANSLAILTGVAGGDTARRIAEKLMTDTTPAPASIYFKYYLHQALTKAGLGDGYLKWLDIWRQNLALGLTTWAETSDLDKTRSDCHAWGASPNIEFFRIVLGIDSEAPGFGKVKIEPHLGDVKRIAGEMPHPAGTVKVEYEVTAKGLKAHIVLPQNTSGRFVWKGKNYALKAGENKFQIQE